LWSKTTALLVRNVQVSLLEIKRELRVKASQSYRNHGAQVGAISAYDAATQAEMQAVEDCFAEAHT
jgi:hypothetical protein